MLGYRFIITNKQQKFRHRSHESIKVGHSHMHNGKQSTVTEERVIREKKRHQIAHMDVFNATDFGEQHGNSLPGGAVMDTLGGVPWLQWQKTRGEMQKNC